ncbi:MAG: hypothetical protein JXN65_04555 [Clostridia bacterium]|nr:hypothetical protein [Clostridia bacterium]
MENICWFCESNDAAEEKAYEVNLKMHNDRKDKIAVNIQRCEECAEKHKKADILSNSMYILELILVAIAYFVFKLEWIYIAIGYFALIRPMSGLSKKIREKVSGPYKSVCDVSKHPVVKDKLEEGYVETRRF